MDILTESGLGLLAESGEPLRSDQIGNIFLDNISLFRQSSLDASLIDLVFNKGTNPQFIDLDALNSSSSSSSPDEFLLLISLDNGVDDYGDEYELPEDLEFYFYDEKVDDIEHPGIFSAQKIPNKNEVIVHFSDSVPPGAQFSFQINIEHPKLLINRTIFKFENQRFYSFSKSIISKLQNKTGRLSPSYISTLHSWISAFWIAYDSNDLSLLPPLVHPPGNENSEFDPFSHARWKVISELGQTDSQAIISGPPTLTPATGRPIDRPKFGNFLGITKENFACIRPKLYKTYDTAITFEDFISGKVRTDERSFNCRAFSIATAMFIENQLSDECKVNVKILTVVSPDPTKNHAICLVELLGCKTDEEGNKASDCNENCCSGSFIYEPQTETRYDSIKSFCDNNQEEGYCTDKSKWDYREIEDAGEYDDNWENDEGEMSRIADAVCSCLTGNYRPGTSEYLIKNRCDTTNHQAFKSWFKNNFKYTPGQSSSPMTGVPQVLSCKKVLCEKGREGGENGPMCTQPPGPGEYGAVTPYICETECVEKWNCISSEFSSSSPPNDFSCDPIYSLKGDLGQYENKNNCLDVCSGDKVCINQWRIKYDCSAKKWVRPAGGESKGCYDRNRFPESENWEVVKVDQQEQCGVRIFTKAGEACSDSTTCQDCAYNNSSCAPSSLGELPAPPAPGCCGSWCEIDPNTYDQTGNCIDGTHEEWVIAERNHAALGYRPGVPCSFSDCHPKSTAFFLDIDHEVIRGGRLGQVKSFKNVFDPS